MGSYLVDANAFDRRARYRARPMPRRQIFALKAAAIGIAFATLWIGFTKVAYGGGRTGTEQLVVQPGETLWEIAATRYPDQDTRTVVSQIVELNHLGGDAIYGGERLTVPAR